MTDARDTRAWIADLAQRFSKSQLLTGDAERSTYESDGLTAFRSKPAAVLLADTQQDVVDAVRICHRHRAPFMARGSGTSLSGGSAPVADGLVIGVNRLNRVVRYDADARIAVVEPGVINADVSKFAADDGLYYAPDPSSGPVCTLGGNVAFNSGGAHCLKYGMTSNHVLGLKVVLPDGELCELGSDSLESVGPDGVGLFCGSEGLFGVALEITLRLLPKPEKFETLQASYDSLRAAGETVSAIVASGLLPGAIEIMDRLAMDAADAAVGAGYPSDAKAMLIVELEGAREEVAEELPRLMELLQDSGADKIQRATSDAERAKIWQGRKCAFSAVGRLSPDFLVQDGVTPRGRLGEALEEIDRLSEQFGLRVANVFHAGDGNLHPLIMFDGRQAGELERAEQLAGEILGLCIRLGGSITGEHGVGLEKRAYLESMYGKANVAWMTTLRRAIDPWELANRGKMLPDAQPDVLTAPGLHPLEQQGVVSRH